MNDIVNWILVLVVLGYVTGLLYVRFTNMGMRRKQVLLKLGEMWGTFGVIIAAMFTARAMLGTVTRSNITDEFGQQWNNFAALTTTQKLLLIVLVLTALIVFIRFFWSLRELDNGVKNPEGK